MLQSVRIQIWQPFYLPGW